MIELIRRLKVWLQTFYNQEYEEVEEAEAKQEREELYASAGNKNLSIRTARIYPKGDVVEREAGSVPLPPATSRTVTGRNRQKNTFRFPLIPDNQANKSSFSRTSADHHPHKPTQQKPVIPVTRHVETGRVVDVTGGATPINRARSEEKKPFRPTEVISPIYGYKRPEPKEETTTENNEKPNPNDSRVDSQQTMHSEWPVDSQQTMHSEWPAASQPVIHSEQQVHSEEIVHSDNTMERENTVHSVENDDLAGSLTPQSGQRETEGQLEWEEEKPDWFLSGLKTSGDIRTGEQDTELQAEPIILERAYSRELEPEMNGHSSVIEVVQQKEQKPAIEGQVHQPVTSSFSQEGSYIGPATSLLHPALPVNKANTAFVNSQQELLAVTLQNFNVHAEVIGAVQGPTVTRYEVQPAPGVKVNKITNLVDDIKLSLAARDIRIEAPIPGRSAVGIEVPNEESVPVYLRGIFESEAFQSNPSPLAVALGLDIGGEPVITDLSKMPHGLIAGATGSGKSVCINSIIVSLLYKASPDDVRLLLIDPKMVELAPYNRLPHLVAPVVTDPKQATAALKWAVGEMDRRYEKFAEAGARDISRYNELMRRSYPDIKEYILPTIVIIIDELADLMMVAPGDVEECICRIAQKARACGIHLLVATQRPSVDVITGLIKANIPTRIAFSVSSQTDSRTILDMNGAERLLGRGDMLYLSSGSSKPVRLQGPYVSDEEIEAVTDFVKSQAEPNYLFEKEDLSQIVAADQSDELFAEAVLFCIENGQASASSLQRNFHIGYNRAARLIDMMTDRGFISGQSGSKARDVFLTQSEYEEIFQHDSRI